MGGILFAAVRGRGPTGGRGLVAADVCPTVHLLGLGTWFPVPRLNGLFTECQWSIVL